MRSTLRWSIVLLLSAMPALAGGPRNVNGLGQPMAWPPGTISYNLDPGPLGQLNSTAAQALIGEAFSVWRDAGIRRVFYDDFESGGTQWASSSDSGATWNVTGFQGRTHLLTKSAQASAFTGFTASVDNRYWRSPLFPRLPANAVLRFQHLMRLQTTRDGGILEISTNGTTWSNLGSLITSGGYNGTISNCCSSPIAGQQAWTGVFAGFQGVEVNLSSYSGQNVWIRFRFASDSDSAMPSDVGWYIDNVELFTRPAAIHNFVVGAALPQDVNADGRPATQPAHYLNFWRKQGDVLSPVIFDHDGKIIDGLFGVGASLDILGAAALDTPTAATPTIAEGSIVLNGLFFDGIASSSNPTDVTRTGMKAVIAHEIGHFLNLDHSLLNQPFAGNGIAADDIYLPTMFPLFVDDEEQLATLHPDDQAAYLDIYTASGAGISGSVTAQGDPYQGVEVVLRKSDDPFGTSYSTYSGGRYFPCNAGSTCDPCNSACNPGHPVTEGQYQIRNLIPGDYRVCIKQVDASPSARGVAGPLAEPTVMPGPEECWDLSESALASDDPDAGSLVADPASTIDIALNALPLSDPYEPSSSAAPATLPEIATRGYKTVNAVLDAGDVDAYSFSVNAGDRVSIDIDAAELGSPLDAVIGVYDTLGALMQTVDDAVDPESRRDSKDSAIELIAPATGTMKVVLSAFPDLDLDGSGQASSGAYWLRVATDLDADLDTRSHLSDNCPTVFESTGFASDLDNDSIGDACDPDQDGDSVLDKYETDTGAFLDAQHTGTDARSADSDGDAVKDQVEIQRGTDPNSDGSSPSLFALPTSLGPTGTRATTADYDFDGDLDLLQSSSTELVYRINDGTGAFTTQTLDSGAVFQAVAWANLRALTVLSAIAVRDGQVVVYDNTAGPGQSIAPGLTGVSEFALGDIDGDGDRDIVTASFTQNLVVWLENRHLPDQSNLWVQHTIASGLPDAFGPVTVAVADFNRDGRPDVAYSGTNAELYERDNLGGGLFDAPIGVGGLGESVLVASDVDRDGDPDLVFSSASNGYVATRLRAPSAPYWLAYFQLTADQYEANSVAVDDVDGDGTLDVAIASATQRPRWYSRFYGTAPYVFSSAASAASGLVLGDFDRDGDPDAAYLEVASGTVKLEKNLRNHSTARFDFYQLSDQPVPAPWNVAQVSWGDFDRDGYVDYAFCQFDGRLAWQKIQFDTGTPGTHEVASDAGNCWELFALDLDGDADLDLAVLKYTATDLIWYANDGSGNFGAQQLLLNFVGYPTRMVFADLDLDTRPDLAVSESGVGISVARNLGGGTFSALQQIESDASLVANELTAGDVDRDGDTDLIAAVAGSGEVAWYAGFPLQDLDLDGTFDLSFDTTRTPMGGVSASYGLGAADIDRDGSLDVVSCTLDGTFLHTEDSFNPGSWITTTISADPCYRMSLADLDRDSDFDVLFDGGGIDLMEWRNNGTALTGPFLTDVATSQDWDLADQDADGDPDLALAQFNAVLVSPNDASWYRPADTDLSPPNIHDGQTALLLRLEYEHRGRASDAPLAITRFFFGYQGPAGPDNLDRNQARALFAAIDVYADDGDGTFEPNQDTIVGTLTEYPSPYTFIYFELGNPAMQLSPGQKRSYFVTVTTTSDASLQSPRDFRIYTSTPGIADVNSGTASPPAVVRGGFSRLITCDRPSAPAFVVNSTFPASGTVNVSTAGEFLIQMNGASDPATASPESVYLESNNVKVPARIIVDESGTQITLDPEGALSANRTYTLHVTTALTDTAGKAASPFVGSYTTWPSSDGSSFGSSGVGGQSSGGQLGGNSPGEQFGESIAAVGDVDGDGIGDIVTGSPGFDDGAVLDVGRATLTFGSISLQSGGSPPALYIQGELAGDQAGNAVARAGLLNNDTLADLAIGAPHANGDKGGAYVVFGNALLRGQVNNTLLLSNLISCTQPTGFCGVKFVGEAVGDKAGASVAFAGDINGDGKQDLLIGAPGADPPGRADAGKVYLVFGPLTAGTIDLSTVGTTTPGRVFYGENAGDRAGETVSWWLDQTNNDDYLIGAPGATPLDEFNNPLPGAGVVYAIHGGAGNLTGGVPSHVIELSRVANSLPDQINGYVFIGTEPGQSIGRSLTGAVDVTGDGVADICFGAEGQAWVIPGDDPKSVSGVSGTKPPRLPDLTVSTASRTSNSDAIARFGSTIYTSGTLGNVGPLSVGGAGDVDNDSVQDLLIGAPQADPNTLTDAGMVLIVAGSKTPRSGEQYLSDVGGTIAGFRVAGTQSGMQLGKSCSGGFDVNGDGLSDALFGAPLTDRGGPLIDAGTAYVLSPVAPPEVLQLMLRNVGASTQLEWGRTNRAVSYSVYREAVATLTSAGRFRTSDAAKLACGINTDSNTNGLPDTTDGTNPGAGQAFVYLVTGRNLQGESLLGASRGAPPRANDGACP